MNTAKSIDTGCRKIFQHYKFEHQKRKLWEEMGELLEALSAVQHSQSPRDFDNVVEELADVHVLLRQFQLHFSIGDENIQRIMKAKVERTIERMKNDVATNLKDVTTDWK